MRSRIFKWQAMASKCSWLWTTLPLPLPLIRSTSQWSGIRWSSTYGERRWILAISGICPRRSATISVALRFCSSPVSHSQTSRSPKAGIDVLAFPHLETVLPKMTLHLIEGQMLDLRLNQAFAKTQNLIAIRDTARVLQSCKALEAQAAEQLELSSAHQTGGTDGEAPAIESSAQ